MSKEKLDTLFHSSDKCQDNECTINKKDIEYIFKPDLGIKDQTTKKAIFGHTVQPSLCDCIIKKDKLILLEIKCGKVTKSILKEIKEQLDNVAKVLKHNSINFDQVLFLYKSLDTNQLKKEIVKIGIGNKTLRGKEYQNKAVEI